jgi:electron transfer flavoprotein alpha subunit
VAEHDNVNLSPSSLSTITAAKAIGGDITVLIMGHKVEEVAKTASKLAGVNKVLSSDHEGLKYRIAEDISPVVRDIATSGSYTHVLAPSSNNGKNFLPRTAALCDSSPLTDVIAVKDESTFLRPMYAGNAIATVNMTDKLKFLLVRPTAFEKISAADSSASIENVDMSTFTKSSTEFKKGKGAVSDRPDLVTANVVISGGRGMKSAENFKLLDQLAAKVGGAVGASRAAVDAGFAPNDYQVGQTGKVVAPDLYFAVGISGAIQHLSGMKDSKTIVAINKDAEAPIFQVADYGLVDDLFKAVPELQEKL